MADITFNGMTMEFNVIESMMDDDTKKMILRDKPGCSEQELLNIYLLLHKQKYGSDFLQS